MARHGRELVDAHHNQSVEMDRVAERYRTLAGSSPSGVYYLPRINRSGAMKNTAAPGGGAAVVQSAPGLVVRGGRDACQAVRMASVSRL